MPVRLKNNARALLAVSISATDTFVRVTAGKGDRFPMLAEGEWFPLFLEDDAGNVEITRAVSRSGDVITVQRGKAGTSARGFSAGARVSLRLTHEATIAYFTGEDPDIIEPGEDDPDWGGAGLIFNGLIVNAYHTETGRQGYFHPNSGTSEGQYVFAHAAYMAARALQFVQDYEEPTQPMTVTGTLSPYVPGAAYEGRLQINNYVGSCKAEQIAGDALPPGGVVRVDTDTMEVVVAWPAYAQFNTTIVNGGFEEFDTSNWTTQQTGGTGRAETTSERPYEGLASGLWLGAKGTGHAGGVECSWENQTQGKVIKGQSVTGSMQIALKDTRSSQNRGRTRLYFYDENGTRVLMREGNLIRGNNSNYRKSELTEIAPADGYVHIGAWTTANDSKNSGVLIDAAQWNVPDSVGLIDERLISLTIRVRDTVGQEATWTGVIGEDAIFLTSRLYGYESPTDAFGPSLGISSFTTKYPPNTTEGFGPNLAVSALSFRSILRGYTAPPEGFTPTLGVSAMNMRSILRTYTGPTEAFTPSMAITAFNIDNILIQQTQPVEAFSPSLAITGVTIT